MTLSSLYEENRRLIQRGVSIGYVRISTVIGEIQRALKLKITFTGTDRQALEQWKQGLKTPSTIRGRVVITALRNRSWIGLGAYMAFVLYQMGYTSIILYRGSVIRKVYGDQPERFSLLSGLASLPWIKLVDLETISTTEQDLQALKACAHECAPDVLAYDMHIEKNDIVEGDARVQSRRQQTIEDLMQIGGATLQVLRDEQPHRVIMYSGLIGESPAILEACKRLRIGAVCIEGWAWRHGHLLCNHDAPALDYDVQQWMRRIQPWSPEKDQEINKYLKFLDGKYEGGSDWLDNFYLIQRSEVGSQFPSKLKQFLGTSKNVTLLTPNVIGDSSTLRRETIFKSQREWLQLVIKHFQARPEFKLVIRAHPAEVWAKAKVKLRMGPECKRFAEESENIFVIDSTEPVNTFDLMPYVSTGLVWVSSAGVDMVLRGVPVIAAAKPKYSGLGIVQEPSSVSSYFAALDKSTIGRSRPTKEQVTAAKQYLYIVFKGFSYQAWSKNTYATGCRLNEMEKQMEHDEFYGKIAEGI